jgi:hypothetical protein
MDAVDILFVETVTMGVTNIVATTVEVGARV